MRAKTGKPMNPRDRVLTAMDHREPDRVPIDFWAASEVTERLARHFGLTDKEALLQRLGVDLRTIEGPSYAGQELRQLEDGSVEDLWGVPRKRVLVERGGFRWRYKHVVHSPLENMTTVAEVDRYAGWPSPDGWDYSTLKADCERFRGYAVVNAGDRLDRTAQLKPMMYLRGMEQAYIDLALDPMMVEAVVGHIREYFLEYNRRVFESAGGKIDIFMMGDDFGTQSGPMMDIAMWRKYFRRGFREYIALAHQYGIRVMHHTCGSVHAFIPEFIDAGLDILQSLQPKAAGMDLKKLKQEYGKDLAFQGGIDIQEVLPAGTPEAVREHVRRQMDAGKPGGGYIACTAHNLQPDTPTENILALFDAYKEFGAY
ncbi:MAG: uroporphyrinogen decarboxylase family protein [Candidatus Latescibacterota bacterium]